MFRKKDVERSLSEGRLDANIRAKHSRVPTKEKHYIMNLLKLVSMNEEATVDTKFIVPVKQVEKALKLSDDSKNELKSVGMMDDKGKLKLKGVSPRMLRRMKLEGVDCPVLRAEIGFIQCYVCKNFHSRISGQVYCRGDPL